MKATFILFLIWISLSINVFAQEVERNYLVEPQKTNCDSLDLSKKSIEEKVKAIKQSKFRFTQKFTLNRKEGFQGGWYYSCDNEKGYLAVKRNDKWELYNDISKEAWQQFIQSGSFEKFIDEHFKNSP